MHDVYLAQEFTDGIGGIYQGTVDPAAIAGKTLRPPRPSVPYIDADGVERQCYAFTVLTNAAGDVAYGASGATNWYVVTTNVTISGKLSFAGDLPLGVPRASSVGLDRHFGHRLGGPHWP